MADNIVNSVNDDTDTDIVNPGADINTDSDIANDVTGNTDSVSSNVNTDNTSRNTGNIHTDNGKNTKLVGNGNLIPFDKLTEEQQREIKRKGALASAEAKRKKKDLREIAKLMLSVDMRDVQIEDILGDDKSLVDGDKSLAAVLTARMAIEAGKGNYKAYEVLRDTAGYKPKDQLEVETVSDADRQLLANVSKWVKPKEIG